MTHAEVERRLTTALAEVASRIDAPDRWDEVAAAPGPPERRRRTAWLAAAAAVALVVGAGAVLLARSDGTREIGVAAPPDPTVAIERDGFVVSGWLVSISSREDHVCLQLSAVGPRGEPAVLDLDGGAALCAPTDRGTGVVISTGTIVGTDLGVVVALGDGEVEDLYASFATVQPAALSPGPNPVLLALTDGPPRGEIVAKVVGGGVADAGSFGGGLPLETTTPPTTGVPSSGLAVACTVLGAEQPEAYVGSQKHLADLDAIAPLVPEDLQVDLATLRAHLVAGIDPGDPATLDVEGWPAEVRSAVGRLTEFAAAACPP